MSRTRQGIRSAAEPESAIQVRPFAVGFTKSFTFARGRSEWHALIYASAGVDRTIDVSPGLAMRSLYFKPGIGRSLPRECCVVNVPPLLRELILHTVDIGMLNRTIPEHARLIGVLLDQVKAVGAVPLQLPQPSEPRAEKVAALLSANPGLTLPLDRLAREAGASSRTIERLFRAQTKRTFAKWRERIRLLHALRLLSGGEGVTNVALELGYASPSAFTPMFRRAFGTTPSRYYSR